MTLKTTTSLAFAAICLVAIGTMPAYSQMAGNNATQPDQGNMASSSAGAAGAGGMTNGPQASRGDMSSSRSARQNVAQSQHYDRTIQTNRGYRQARMRKECGPITDQQLRQSCLASFNQDEPAKGSSHPHRTRHS